MSNHQVNLFEITLPEIKIDKPIRRAEKVCSSTQLYKQAGNSIVVDVLVGIFGNLNIKGCPNWEEYTKEKTNG